ncbi:hypothetical protein JNUCC0626_18000 [Lentzea sp. JNUCC 0626]|uniref:hypothetical protein n=1 Tax=Lentzea sp. JNUCC 0626 TaxID=3367513 RepID=UPI0037484914
MPRLLIAAFALLLAGCAAAPEPTPVSSETTTQPDRPLSDAQLQAQWWTWAASSTEKRNPVVDDSGQWCAENQPKDVWFFAGTFGGSVNRRCQVPAGRPLAGPAVNTYTNCDTFFASAKGSVTLDGQLVELRRIDSAPITFDAVRDNVLGAPTGKVNANACGLWAWIPPLSPGEHELRVQGEFGTFRTSARYILTVGASD